MSVACGEAGKKTGNCFMKLIFVWKWCFWPQIWRISEKGWPLVPAWISFPPMLCHLLGLVLMYVAPCVLVCNVLDLGNSGSNKHFKSTRVWMQPCEDCSGDSQRVNWCIGRFNSILTTLASGAPVSAAQSSRRGIDCCFFGATHDQVACLLEAIESGGTSPEYHCW